jgi:hypothetical protein
MKMNATQWIFRPNIINDDEMKWNSTNDDDDDDDDESFIYIIDWQQQIYFNNNTHYSSYNLKILSS